MVSVNDGVLLVVGELRAIIAQKDEDISKLIQRNEALSSQISKLSSELHEVIDSNRKLLEKVKSLEVSEKEASRDASQF